MFLPLGDGRATNTQHPEYKHQLSAVRMLTSATELLSPPSCPCFSVTYTGMKPRQLKLLQVHVSKVLLSESQAQLSSLLPRETPQYKATFGAVETRPTFWETTPDYMDDV